jgi:hypothetical protein
MESYDVFLMGNFVALPAFTKDYGIWNELKQEYVVAPAWQSALQGMFPWFLDFTSSSFDHSITSLHKNIMLTSLSYLANSGL